jgi:hypothetical protein
MIAGFAVEVLPIINLELRQAPQELPDIPGNCRMLLPMCFPILGIAGFMAINT